MRAWGWAPARKRSRNPLVQQVRHDRLCAGLIDRSLRRPVASRRSWRAGFPPDPASEVRGPERSRRELPWPDTALCRKRTARVDGFAIARRYRNADAQPDHDLMAGHPIGRADGIEDPLRHRFRVAGRNGFLNQDEFVAAHSHDEIGGTGNRFQPCRDLLQQSVPDGMTEPVVGRLEMIEVDGVDGNRAALAVSQHLDQVGVEDRAVEDAGQGIEPRKLFELPLESDVIDRGIVAQANHFKAADKVDGEHQARDRHAGYQAA